MKTKLQVLKSELDKSKKKAYSEETRIKMELIKRGANRATFYYKITKERVEKMKVQDISEGVAHGKMKSKYFNPVYFYPKGVRLLRNEIGHDRVYRYIIKI